MLTHLSLKNFVIVRELSLDIRNGLTVLTGETGAGKSILIDALQFILGARADTGVIREGAEQTDLQAIFDISEAIADMLRNQALLNEDDLLDKSVIVRRIIDRNGRSRAWINGVNVTVGQLKALGEMLLDIHGQHAHQSLLKPSGQLDLLDAFGAYREDLQGVRQAYSDWQQAKKALESAKANAQKLADEAERLAWVNEELESIAPQKDEWEALNAEHKRLASAHDILDELQSAANDLSEADHAAVDLLAEHAEKLAGLAESDPRLGEIAGQLSEAQAIAEDAVRELERYRDRTDLDESRFEEVDARVSLFFNAARKFHVLPEALYEKWVQIKEKLKTLEQGLDVKELELAVQHTYRTFEQKARMLSQKRQAAARTLSAKVTDAMQSLSMKGGRFEVTLLPCEASNIGLERCEFFVAGHTGVAVRPLSKVASGGELSRISLAIAVITATATPVDTLIFDEVDSGISGAVADVVGRLLKTLSSERQVLCVTHLPQVAAYGKNHLHVSKAETAGTTQSRVTELTEAERIRELARMLGGHSVTDKALENAKEMLLTAQAYTAKR
ncbi:MAG TPA: DNA repair protein RecN [Candidatus Aphodousia gallistercoris]|nr:DNA repair protein RecN [Candidatus Aphodousia gallistercoris]